jgi:aminotransferase
VVGVWAAAAVVLNGCSKAFAMTGWRVGYLAAPAGFVEAITAIAGQLSLSVATPSQYAAIAALSGPMDAVNEMMEVYSERREYMIGEFAKMGFAVYGGHGGYIALLDTLSGCGLSAPEFSLRLLKETGVQIGSWGAGMSGEVEHESGRFARISWLLPMDELAIAMDKIATFVGRVKAEEEGEAAAGGRGGAKL